MGQEIRDENGNVLGYFLTQAEYQRREYELAEAEFARQAAEEAAKGIVRKWDGTNGRTTTEVLETLRKLDEQTGGGR